MTPRAFAARWWAIVREHDWQLAALVLAGMETARAAALAAILLAPGLVDTLPRFGGYEAGVRPAGWAAALGGVALARLVGLYRDDASLSSRASFAASVVLGFLVYAGMLTTGNATAPSVIHHAVAAAHSAAAGVVYLRAKRAARAVAHTA